MENFNDSKALAIEIAKILDKKKAHDVRVLKVESLTVLTDYFVIASGTSTTQVASLADEVEFELSQKGLEPYSTEGYDYAMEKAGSTQGWTFTVFEEAFNQGYPQELAHFIHCVRTGEKPLVTGEDGRAVLEMVYAAYASAKEGRKIALPFSAKVKYPIELMR